MALLWHLSHWMHIQGAEVLVLEVLVHRGAPLFLIKKCLFVISLWSLSMINSESSSIANMRWKTINRICTTFSAQSFERRKFPLAICLSENLEFFTYANI